ncbi:uncharacterized protein RAG0_02502 [Rhynchosporium agropyri]|uniref:Uncharacterized protein n=1 Tax=Rhynchosporium agropyri TaxID=914238 RepID=A0A1E1K1R8_9HELO|nr:uncharacterized protein RAG0_02502 [Rhynchosporium agropyri]
MTAPPNTCLRISMALDFPTDIDPGKVFLHCKIFHSSPIS